MSARAPFIPQRPQSDQNPAESPSHHAHDTFHPTGLLSASVESSSDSQSDSAIANKNQNKADPESDSSSLTNGTNKPLNLSGFKKKSHQHPAAIPGKTRKSFEESAARSRSPRPFSQAQQNLRIAAPRPSSPFFPTSGFVPVGAFRTPAMPHSSRLHSVTSGDDLGANIAHTSTSTADGMDGRPERPSDGFRFSPAHDPVLLKSRMRSSSHPSLEKIHETAEDDEQYAAFDNAQDGPPLAGTYEIGGQDAEPTAGDVHEQQTLRRTNKRAPLSDEDADALDYGGTAKRYKMDANANEFAPPYSRHAAQYAVGTDGAHREFVPPYTPAAQQSAPPVHVLHRLLGQELDAYVDAHVDVYEQAKKKWAECSMDEWTAGADEITGRFAKMLDFVKDHMASKLTLYASLHSSVAVHRAVLSEREKVLGDARESLVREGGAVVGGAGPSAGGHQNNEGN